MSLNEFMDKIIYIESMSDYQFLHPDRKLIDLETLMLVKYLRSKNIKVVILPANNQPVEYLFKKGVNEWLSQPLNLLIASGAMGVIGDLVSSFIKDILKKRTNRKVKEDLDIVIAEDNVKKVFLGLNGLII